MTVGTEFYNWQTSGLIPGDAPFNRCAPALESIEKYLTDKYGGKDLGCFQVRPIRGGEAPSSHSYGAAKDWRYEDPGVGRKVLLDEILPFLIDHSKELGIQAIHDYVGCRIWRANRSSRPQGGWQKQKPDAGSGMGQAWAAWIHIEVTRDAWDDGRSVAKKILAPEPPKPPKPDKPVIFDPANGKFGLWPAKKDKPTIQRGARGDSVKYAQGVLRKARYQVAVDGDFGLQTVDRVRRLQQREGLTVDGVIGPQTWKIIDRIAKG